MHTTEGTQHKPHACWSPFTNVSDVGVLQQVSIFSPPSFGKWKYVGSWEQHDTRARACVCVSVGANHFNVWTDFQETWNDHYSIRIHLIAGNFIFLQWVPPAHLTGGTNTSTSYFHDLKLCVKTDNGKKIYKFRYGNTFAQCKIKKKHGARANISFSFRLRATVNEALYACDNEMETPTETWDIVCKWIIQTKWQCETFQVISDKPHVHRT